MQARYYDPVIGRFYSNDPIGFTGHMRRGKPIHEFNRYTYANNNPYRYVDPNGKIGQYWALRAVGKTEKERVKLSKEGAERNVKVIVGGLKLTSAGHVIDGVEVASQLATGEPIADDIAGKGASELTGAIVGETLEQTGTLGKIVSAILGAIVGDEIKESVNESIKEETEKTKEKDK